MKTCLIFGNADINSYSDLNIDKDSFVIAADGGYRHCRKLGIIPDILLGDFDSINEELPSDCEIIKLPSEKDDTDMMHAVKTALERGYEDIKMYGVLGGRLDHTYSNIQTLEYINLHGANGSLIDTDNEVQLLTSGAYTYFKRGGWYLSIFSFSGTTEVTTTGTKYNLENYKLTRNFPLGVSNEIIDDLCRINVFSGVLLVILSKR